MSESGLDHVYPGVDRMQYFVAKVCMIVVVVFVVAIFGPRSPVMRILGLLLMVSSVVLDVMRLRNIGVSQWYAFVRFLPFGNTVLDICLQSAQTGWVETRRLDRNGKSIFIVELLFIGLMLFVTFRSRTEMPFYF
jgi:uncharacterized membrane protein YhaH (DUF805 family)